MFQKLLTMIEKRTAKIAVFGQGYVGLPLAISFALHDFQTYGVDIDAKLVNSLNRGMPPAMDDFVEANLKRVVDLGRYTATINGLEAAERCNINIICVPTPLNANGEPDLTFMKDSAALVVKTSNKPKLLIVESSTYPGSIEDIVVPIIEKNGFILGKDIFLAHCPERVDPRNKLWTLHNTTRIVGGYDIDSTLLAKALYQTIMTAPLIEVSNIKTAEAVKELENTFRLVNISLVNEFALYCERFGLDTYEVIEAASTKPFGFSPHYPGPGVGGHCIPVDPVYLWHSAKQIGLDMDMIETALEVNKRMPDHVVKLVRHGFATANKKINDGYTVVVGISYKEDIDDIRESPGLKIAEKLDREGFNIKIFEPYLKERELKELGFEYITTLNKDLNDVSCLCVVQFHSNILPMINRILRENSVPIIVDCKNGLHRHISKNGPVVVRLGSSLPEIK